MERGAIIEEGNHQTLLPQGGHYADTSFRLLCLEYVEKARSMAEGEEVEKKLK